ILRIPPPQPVLRPLHPISSATLSPPTLPKSAIRKSTPASPPSRTATCTLATPSTCGDLAILVHNHVRETDTRSLVAPSIPGTLCTDDRARTRDRKSTRLNS